MGIETAITDEFMREMIAKTRDFTIMLLHPTAKLQEPGADRIVWEHGRRNFRLRAEGVLRIVCPVRDGSAVCGVGIFAANVDDVKAIMDGDPGVQAGLFTYETHPCRSFPGDAL